MFDEKTFKSKAVQHIQRCRAGDWEHALRVVEWVRELGKGREDLPLLLAAAYIHDIGWRDVLPTKKLSFDELLEYEGQANKNSEQYARSFLEEMQFDAQDIKTVLRLIAAADAHQSERDDEAIIVDTDNLSKLCIEHLQEKYQQSEWIKLCEMWETELPKRMKTEKGKKVFQSLLRKLRAAIMKSGRKDFQWK
jgi:predicted metal-dependent HD superfamily phosphohydrolase